MPQANVSFTVRMAPKDLKRVDACLARAGFSSCSKFLSHAALAFDADQGMEEIIGHLSEISFELHRLNREGQRAPAAVRKLFKSHREAMATIIAGLQA